MRALTGQQALQAWERGQRLDTVDRALALLSAATPETLPERLAELPVGQRDGLLIRLRELTFGREQRCFARCLKCDAPLEFTLDLRTFDAEAEMAHKAPAERYSVDGYEILFRLPNSLDMRFLAEYGTELGTARQMLIDRCFLEARRGREEVSPAELPASVVEAVGLRMEELDPLAELPLAIDCGRCGYAWEILLDLGVLLWDEVEASAKSLLYEVHTLARAYGWTESEILSLSAARRRSYLSQVKPKGD